jgi:hypothetical protein
LAPALSLLAFLTVMAALDVWRNPFLKISNTLLETAHFDERSRLDAVPVFENQSARQTKPIRIVMIKFCIKSIIKRSSRSRR